MQAAARSLGPELHVLNVSTERDFDAVFANLIQLRAGGLLISGGQFFNSRSKQLAAMALQHALPTIFPYRDLRSCWRPDELRQLSLPMPIALPASTPAEFSKVRSQPICRSNRHPKVELIVNLKTAKALGVTVPMSFYGRADQVIE